MTARRIFFTSTMPIHSPKPMFDHLIELPHRDDSSKWSNIQCRIWWRFYTSRANWTSFYAVYQELWCTVLNLLFISYKFVKGFLEITFLLLVFSNWNFHDVCQRFLYTQKWKFSWIRQKTKIFPVDPHYKNHPLL